MTIKELLDELVEDDLLGITPQLYASYQQIIDYLIYRLGGNKE